MDSRGMMAVAPYNTKEMKTFKGGIGEHKPAGETETGTDDRSK